MTVTSPVLGVAATPAARSRDFRGSAARLGKRLAPQGILTIAVVAVNSDASPTTLTRAKSNVAQSGICTQIVLHGAGNTHVAGAPQETVDEPLSPFCRHPSAMPPGPPTLNATTIILA
jgi:hypothetical protein